MLSKRTPKHARNTIITLAAAAMFTVPLLAQASECSTDSDCAEGEFCELFGSPLVPCSIDEEGNEVCDEPIESEQMGLCQERPIECEQDSDCPSHLSCGWGSMEARPTEGGGAEPAPAPSENVEESDPDPIESEEPDETDGPMEPIDPEMNEQMMCVFVPSQCEADNDCEMHFHCELQSVGVSCGGAAVPCQEGEDCDPQPEPDCIDEEVTEGYCMPDEIDCDGDDMCPEDWRCREIVESDCNDIVNSTEDRATDSQGFSDEEPSSSESSAERSVEPVECMETTRSLCVPAGLSAPSRAYDSEVVEGELATNDSDTEREDEGELSAEDQSAGSSNGDVEESGGCDASQTAPTAWALLAILMTLGLRRRFI